MNFETKMFGYSLKVNLSKFGKNLAKSNVIFGTHNEGVLKIMLETLFHTLDSSVDFQTSALSGPLYQKGCYSGKASNLNWKPCHNGQDLAPQQPSRVDIFSQLQSSCFKYSTVKKVWPLVKCFLKLSITINQIIHLMILFGYFMGHILKLLWHLQYKN